MRFFRYAAAALLCCGAAWAQQAKPVSQPQSFDLKALDKSADPCEDFYQYACGGWNATHPLPGDKSRYGRFDELAEYNRQLLHNILDKAASKPGSPLEKKIGDYYAACMDTEAIEKRGTTPLAKPLAIINAVKDRKSLVLAFAELESYGVGTPINFGIEPDMHNSTINIAAVDQGGGSLPDRDYYLSDATRMQTIRKRYVEHVTKMFTLLGDKPEVAAAEAQAVLALETKIAKAEMSRVERREPKNLDHKMTVAELDKLAPAVEFPLYFKTIGVGAFKDLNVGNPKFEAELSGLLTSESIADWKTYLRWHALHSAAGSLPKAFDDENFDFFSRFLSGRKEQEARWKRCSSSTDRALGEALGQIYVQTAFPPEAKSRMDALVAGIEKSMELDINTLEWMTPETKKAAQAKLVKVSNKIGYPSKWKDYSSVVISRDDMISNLRNAMLFEQKREFAKLGQKVDKNEWGMTPPTVNAYYNPQENNINFPAGILQPPFFSAQVDEAVNYGAIGVVIGHELTHGFDDEGRQFDGDGNLTDWWGAKDNAEFEKRADCTVQQYSSFSPVQDDQGKDIHVNGKLTLGENTADNGGMKLAIMALERQIKERPELSKVVEGFTPEQRFFLGFAQVWCQNVTPESSRMLVLTDPHSPGKFRVFGAVQNSDEFRKAFSCKAGQKMAPETKCQVW